MNRDFIKYLIVKPESYILIWAYIYSRLDDNNCASIYIHELIGRYKVPKSTMKRIVDYGMSFSELKLNYKWINNYLHISSLDVSSEPNVNEKQTKKGPKVIRKQTRKPATKLYSKMVDKYDKFCIEQTGVGCKIDGAQGKSLKQIIKFLETQCKKKNELQTESELEENVLLSWEYILSNWNKLDDFYSGKVKLTEINSNMSNILVKIKQKPKINKNNRNEQINQAIRGASDTDYSGLGS